MNLKLAYAHLSAESDRVVPQRYDKGSGVKHGAIRTSQTPVRNFIPSRMIMSFIEGLRKVRGFDF
ncbi:MAG: hypothetical protein NPIRA04_14790 [Nitrospirales bacterium]|nr:MAG: hypothetical protein NPIRA04_14790 [Nitrospirales bacterium]